MHILIMGTLYEPDLGPSAALFTLLSENLVRRGHQVTVISSVPHYPSGRVPSAFRGKWIWRSFENGVEVIRIGLPSVDRTHLPQRLLQIICYQLGTTFVGMGQRYDALLSGGPSLSVWLPFAWLVALRHKPAVYSVNDVYPDVGIKLGIFKHKLVISTVAALERFCLNQSTIVQIISDSFRPGLRALGVPDSKMALVHLWVDTNLIRPLPHDNAFAQEHGLTDQFVVSYAGNIGRSQGLEYILDVAKLLADQRDIRFVFVGDGAGRELLQNQAKQRHLPNVQFIPFQPRERLPEVLAIADVSLVILRRGLGSDSLPSKTFSIMASGRPILVSVDEESEISKLVKRAEAGLSVPPEDPARLAEAILTLKHDKDLRERLGRNGRILVEQHHSPQYAAEQFEKLLLAAISSKSRH
jgi:colanic acid biosynthesis glycosyl transferase WcaI